jgi:uridine kinase
MKNIIWIYGPSCTGKTMFANLIAGLTNINESETLCFPFSKYYFLKKLVLPTTKCLIIDGFFAEKEKELELLNEIIDVLNSSKRDKVLIIISQNTPPQAIYDKVLLLQSYNTSK